MSMLSEAQEVSAGTITQASCIFSEKELGLKISLNKPTNIKSVLENNIEGLGALAQKHRLIVLKNAFVTVASNIDASYHKANTGFLQQDFFHRDDDDIDDLALSENHISILHKALHNQRDAPTYYAHPDDVRRAIKIILDNKNANHSQHVRIALGMMLHNNYTFSLEKGSLEARRIMEDEYPNFTKDVFDLIPSDKRYAHYWRSGERSVLIHTSCENSLLHARPQIGNDTHNCLEFRSHPL